VYFCFAAAVVGYMFWLPQMIKSSGIKDAFHVGLLFMIPNVVTILGMIWAGRHSDRTLERRWHILTLSLIAALGLALSGVYGDYTWAAVFAASVGLMGVLASQVIYWSIPTAILTGTASAGGIALINSTGALSGFFTPFMLGYVKDTTQSLALGLYVLSALLILAGVLVMLFGPRRPNSITLPQEARPVVSPSA
jgi:nitrate/nitrite transporter NarK